MKNLKIFFCTLLLCFSLAFTKAQSVKLQEGSTVRMALKQELNSKTAVTGSIVELEVVDDVDVEGVIVIKAGTPVKGEITEASKSKMLGKPGKLDFMVNFTRSVDGQNIRLRSNQTFAGKDKSGLAVGGGLLLFPPLLIMKGKDVVIKNGQNFTAYIDKDYTIQAVKDGDTASN